MNNMTPLEKYQDETKKLKVLSVLSGESMDRELWQAWEDLKVSRNGCDHDFYNKLCDENSQCQLCGIWYINVSNRKI